MKELIREIPDFPAMGIKFKDITPIFSDIILCKSITECIKKDLKKVRIDAVACIESRGFWFGMTIAQSLNVPFVPIRKKGKLPGTIVTCTYDLQFGTSCVEMNNDAIKKGWNVLIHNDILATGGTAAAASELIIGMGAMVSGYSFLIELPQLEGRKKVEQFSNNIHSIVKY